MESTLPWLVLDQHCWQAHLPLRHQQQCNSWQPPQCLCAALTRPPFRVADGCSPIRYAPLAPSLPSFIVLRLLSHLLLCLALLSPPLRPSPCSPLAPVPSASYVDAQFVPTTALLVAGCCLLAGVLLAVSVLLVTRRLSSAEREVAKAAALNRELNRAKLAAEAADSSK